MASAPSEDDPLELGTEPFQCAFCGNQAVQTTERMHRDRSRTCECGALVLSAAQGDFDEITDAAIDLFRVQTRRESRGDDMALRADILRSGIEIRQGAILDVELPWGMRTRIYYVWFRRQQDES